MADRETRSEALERATYIAAHQQVGSYNAEVVLNIARFFETYLDGKDTTNA